MNTLKELREEIDAIDAEIISLLTKRMDIVDKIGALKRSHHYNVVDTSREEEIMRQIDSTVSCPLQKAEISNIFQEIIKEARKRQLFFQHPHCPFKNIGIIGLGLMGGSLCKALKIKDKNIKISTLAPLEDEGQQSWIDNVYSSLAELIPQVDLLILASPISTIIPYAHEIKESLPVGKKLVIIDIAGVKQEISATFEKLTNEEVEYISTHPMSGKEKCGFPHSDPTLFIHRPWIVVPHDKNTTRALRQICALIHFCGGEPQCLDAEPHDHQAALISHLPYVIAKSYLDFVQKRNPHSLTIAGPGFDSFSRIAKSNPSMRREIAERNGEILQSQLNLWIEHITNSVVISNNSGREKS